MRQGVVSRDEWRWAMLVGASVVALTFLPYAVGWLKSSPEQVFTGSVFMQEDAYSYLAKMRLGAQGHWLFQDVYAVEPHREALVYFPYLLVGHIAGLIGGPRPSVDLLMAIFHIWRVGGAALLMWALYRLYARLLPEIRQRRLAYFLALVGGGLGGLMALVGLGVIDGWRPIDLYLGEAYGFVALFALPHVLVARACAVLAALRLAPLVEENTGGWKDAVIISGLWLIMALCVPFYPLVAAAMAAAWIALRALHSRTIPWRAVLWGGLAGAPAGVSTLITFLTTRGDTVYDAWNSQNLLPAPPIWNFAVAFGLPLAAALVGGYAAWRERTQLVELCLGWMMAAAVLVMIPINVQLRLIEGAYIPLWGLAAAGLYRLLERLDPPVGMNEAAQEKKGRSNAAPLRALRGAALATFVILSILTTSFLVIGGTALPLGGFGNVFISGDLDGALEWLNRNAPLDSVVLAGQPVGVYAPARAGIRSVVGHGFETPYYDRKVAEVGEFYLSGVSDPERAALLERYQVRYILDGPEEWAWACQTARCNFSPFDPRGLPLRAVYSQGETTIYEVVTGE